MFGPTRALFAACLLAACGVGVRATDSGSPADSAKPAASSANGQKAVGQLTNESLGTMLDDLGYEYTTSKLPSGDTLYTVTIERDDWTYVISMALSKNRKFVWIDAPLHTLPPEGSVEAEPLVRVLQETWKVGPHVFSVHKDSRRLYLQRVVENENVTRAKLRDAVDAMTSTIRTTAPVWDIPELGKPTEATRAVSGRGAPKATAGLKSGLQAAPQVPGIGDTTAADRPLRAPSRGRASALAGVAPAPAATADDPSLTMYNGTPRRVTFYVNGTRRCQVAGGYSCTVTIKPGRTTVDTYDANGKWVLTKTFTAESGMTYTYRAWVEGSR